LEDGLYRILSFSCGLRTFNSGKNLLKVVIQTPKIRFKIKNFKTYLAADDQANQPISCRFNLAGLPH
jgi:hypothetical protein